MALYSYGTLTTNAAANNRVTLLHFAATSSIHPTRGRILSANELERYDGLSVVNVIRTLVSTAVAISEKSPYALARSSEIRVVKNLPYRDTGHPAHFLDVIRQRHATEVQPALLYIHGGGFAVCSKETHEIFTTQYARMGFTVFSINYRLMPEYRFPAGFHDCCDALLWVLENAHRYQADVSRLVLAGESAGGNLSLALATAASYRDGKDAWAARVYDAEPSIAALIPACGVLQVSGMQRLWSRARRTDPITRGFLSAMQRDYLPKPHELETPTLWADPLVTIERRELTRSFPPTFVFCGTKDILLEDTERLAARLKQLNVPVKCGIYDGEMHVFHAFLWRPNARRCWYEQREFLKQYIQGLTPRKKFDARGVPQKKSA